jgi:hypothetical protein
VTSGARGPRRADAAFLGVLLLGALWLTVGKSGGARVATDAEHFLIMFPGYLHAARAIAAGRLPLWNALLQCGMPQLGNLETASLYPPTWIFAALPAAAALQALIVFHWWLAGVGVYGFARALGLRPLPAFVAAYAYQFSGCVLWLTNFSFFASLGLVPFLLWSLERLGARPSAGRLACAAAAAGLPFYAGHPQIWSAALPLGAAYAVVSSRQRGRAALGYCLASLVAGVLAAAPVMLAGLELLGFSVRGSYAPHWVGQPAAVILLKTLFFGRLSWEAGSACPSVGPLVLGLAAASLFGRSRRSETAFWWGAAGIGFLAALGERTPFSRLLRLLPVFSHFTAPERWLFVLPLSLGLLAAFTLDEKLHSADEDAGPRGVWLTAAAIGLPCLAAAAVERRWLDVLLNHGFDVRAAAASAALALLALAAALGARSRRGLSLGIAAALAFSFWRLEKAELAPTTTAEVRASVVPSPLAAWILARRGREPYPPRVAGLFNIEDLYERRPPGPPETDHSLWKEGAVNLLAANLTSNVGLPNASAMASAFILRPYEEAGVADTEQAGLADPRLLAPGNPVLDRLSVRYLAVPRWERRPEVLGRLTPPAWSLVREDVVARLYENRGMLPRFRFARSARRAVSTAPDRDGRFLRGADAVIEEDFPGALDSLAPGSVEALSYEDERIDLSAEVAGDWGLLVAAETYYPGWRAFVDGRPARVLKVDGMMRGVAVPRGRHEVVFEYSPSWLRSGGALAAAGLALLAALSFRLRRDGDGSGGSAPAGA